MVPVQMKGNFPNEECSSVWKPPEPAEALEIGSGVPLTSETSNCLKATEGLVWLPQGDIWPWWETLWVITTDRKIC